jgi:hypothetical protein
MAEEVEDGQLDGNHAADGGPIRRQPGREIKVVADEKGEKVGDREDQSMHDEQLARPAIDAAERHAWCGKIHDCILQ